MRFVIRVYGVIINSDDQILLSSEIYQGLKFVKFPGGGLEFGEGTRDGLQREIHEELGLKAEIEEHLYTADFYLESAFNPEDQILSVYYKVWIPEWKKISTEPWPPVYDERKERFHWINRDFLHENMLNFPADKTVIQIIKHSKKQ